MVVQNVILNRDKPSAVGRFTIGNCVTNDGIAVMEVSTSVMKTRATYAGQKHLWCRSDIPMMYAWFWCTVAGRSLRPKDVRL